MKEPHEDPADPERGEAKRLLPMAGKLQVRVLLSIGYGAGLRVSEVVRLKVKHIDSALGVIRVEQGKGRKDRQVMLSPETLDLLRSGGRSAPTSTIRRAARGALAVPGPPQGAAPDATAGQPPVPGDRRGGRDQEEGHAALAAAQLCHPSVRPRGRYPNDPGFARTREVRDNSALHACRDGPDHGGREPARQAVGADKAKRKKGKADDKTPA